MEMTTHKINIKINLGGLIDELSRSVQRTISLVAAGLHVKQYINSESLHLPDVNMGMRYDRPIWTTDQIQIEYDKWLLTNGFRDVTESVSAFMESAHDVLSYWEIACYQQSRGEVRGGDWNRIIVGGHKSFNKRPFPSKLDHISSHQINIDTNLKNQVLTINATRNCLVHRRGIVADADLNIDGGLQIEWTKMALIFINKDGEKEVVPPFNAEKGDKIAIRNKEEKKIFPLGTQIQFTVQEFSDICWCVFLFGNSLKESIQKRGVELGLVKVPADC
jgi:hypothetical protein